MNLLEITLIIIGIIIIIISCRLVDKSGKSKGQVPVLPFSYENGISEEDKKKLMDKIKELLSDVGEETVIRTDDTLSQLSNEKIMAVSEYSDQILEKIKRNHEEVVFLYNMLNDKEKDLKSVVREIDSSKKKNQDMMEPSLGSDKVQTDNREKATASEKTITQAAKMEKPLKSTESQSDNSFLDNSILNNLSENNNTQILALFNKGKSVMEISKLLGLGQGEVKLVIDLFKGKK